MPNTPHFFDLNPDDLRERLVSWEIAPYRAQQIFSWVYDHGVGNPQQMINLPKRDRETLARRMRFTTGTVVAHQTATDHTQKLLIQWPPPPPDSPPDFPPPPAAAAEASHPLPLADDPSRQTECVMIPSKPSNRVDDVTPAPTPGKTRRTACISSQIGCPVGCRFCASGLGGLEGNLTSGQIVEQVWRLNNTPGVDRITHVVFMGMGEPLANFDRVLSAVRTLTARWGFKISARRITISTVGLPPAIRRLAEVNLPVTLALSLHAPNDELRRELIPWARHVTIHELIDAARDYFDRTGREITLEYILLRDVNDLPHHARELAAVARRLRSNVNLIRYNEVKGLPFSRPETRSVHHFQQALRAAGVNTHIRASRGRDIAAACGQLRHEQSPMHVQPVRVSGVSGAAADVDHHPARNGSGTT